MGGISTGLSQFVQCIRLSRIALIYSGGLFCWLRPRRAVMQEKLGGEIGGADKYCQFIP